MPSADADIGLNQRVDPIRHPYERGAARPVKGELVASIKHGVAQLREAALDEATLEEPEAAERSEGIVVAERDQRTEIVEAEWRHRLAIAQPSRQVADQVQGLLISNLGS